MTGSLSKKTSYLVVGEEAGESKLTKVSITIYHHRYMCTFER